MYPTYNKDKVYSIPLKDFARLFSSVSPSLPFPQCMSNRRKDNRRSFLELLCRRAPSRSIRSKNNI